VGCPRSGPALFSSRASLSRRTLALLEDYDRAAEFYRPDRNQIRGLVSRSGDGIPRLSSPHQEGKVITAVFDTEYDVQYTVGSMPRTLRAARTALASREVERCPANPENATRPAGQTTGFLWRLYTYWRFYQADGGVYIQCEAISLTRDVPAGLSWLVDPFITKIPSESLRRTLESTRAALRTFPKGEDHDSANGSFSSH